MPYVITTTTRRAVATLEEARAAAKDVIVSTIPDAPGRKLRDTAFYWTTHVTGVQFAHELNILGKCTVGPLPDGTVIEVEQVFWRDLTADYHLFSQQQNEDIIDAYNAR